MPPAYRAATGRTDEHGRRRSPRRRPLARSRIDRDQSVGMSTVSIRYTVALAVCTPPQITLALLTIQS